MKKKLTLKGRQKFQKVMRGKVIKQGGLTVFVVPGRGRIGVTPHSNVKGAVNRNRVKRHLREYARVYILPQVAGKDVVLIAPGTMFRRAPVNLG